MFQPDRSAAERQLEAFLPRAGRDYAIGRNFDCGPEGRSAVSKLSPWIRVRLLPEWAIVRGALQRHSASEANKFIDEVCWRTYWKGWLALRPTIWRDYVATLGSLYETEGQSDGYTKAISGQSGIECFDAWAGELIETGYLHNHARMWFASIWIHTLKLPWELGAEFFLRHLLDGDAASNTLSWRWVAGLHTKGKAYLARESNIAKFTNGRFPHTPGLSNAPAELDFQEHPPVEPLKPRPFAEAKGKTGLLLTEDDLSAQHWLSAHYAFGSMATLLPQKSYASLGMSESVTRFRESLLRETSADAHLFEPAAVPAWAREHNLQTVVMAEPAVGLWDQAIIELEDSLAKNDIELIQVRHWWDDCLYPHATHGFFRFKKAIPEALDLLKGTSGNLKQPELFHA